MEQMTLFADKDWKTTICDVLSQIIVDKELPPQSLVLTENFSEKKGKITSYTLSVKKPDYPRGINSSGIAKTPLFNIQPKPKQKNKQESLAFNLSDELISAIKQQSFDVEFKTTKNGTQVLVDPDNKDYNRFISYTVETALSAYMSEGGSAFGCCSLYKECSDAKKCLHENKLYALGCAYYHNLREGRIFYGANRNV